MSGLVCAWLLALSGACDLDLASAIADGVVEAAPLWSDDTSKVRTATLVVAVAWRESKFDQSARSATNDFCVMQVHNRPDLGGNLRECIRVGLEALRWSSRVCAAHPVAAYVAGVAGCSDERAKRMSRDRVWLAAQLTRGGVK